MTMSGRSLETMMLAGRVPPVVVKSGISEKIWVFFEFGPMALLTLKSLFRPKPPALLLTVTPETAQETVHVFSALTQQFNE